MEIGTKEGSIHPLVANLKYCTPQPGVDPVLDVLRKYFQSQIRWMPNDIARDQPTFTVIRHCRPPTFTFIRPHGRMSLASLRILPSPVDLAANPPIYEITKHAGKRITFGPKNLTHIKILAKLDASGAGVLVKHHTAAAADWQPLPAFVASFGPVPARDTLGVGSPLWHTSYAWATNGQTFPLLALPAELRDLVYAACAPASCRPAHFHNGGAGAILSLLLTNKQVSREFAAVLRESCEFRFGDVGNVTRSAPLFGKVVSGVGRARRWRTLLRCELPMTTLGGTLTRLRLELDTDTWLHVARLDAHMAREVDLSMGEEVVAGTWLEQLRGLKSVVAVLGHKDMDSTAKMWQSGQSAPRLCHRISTGLVLLGVAGLFGTAEDVRVEGCVSKELQTMFVDFLAGGKSGVETVSVWDILGWDGGHYQDNITERRAGMTLRFPTFKKHLVIPISRSLCRQTGKIDGTPRDHRCDWCYCGDRGCVFKTNFAADPVLRGLFG